MLEEFTYGNENMRKKQKGVGQTFTVQRKRDSNCYHVMEVAERLQWVSQQNEVGFKKKIFILMPKRRIELMKAKLVAGGSNTVLPNDHHF